MLKLVKMKSPRRSKFEEWTRLGYDGYMLALSFSITNGVINLEMYPTKLNIYCSEDSLASWMLFSRRSIFHMINYIR